MSTKKSSISNKALRALKKPYIWVLLLFLVWMFFFDTNSYFIHRELNQEIKTLEQTKSFYESEIENDQKFIEKMQDSDAMEAYGREKYYLKKDKEEIFIIAIDSLQ